MAQPIIGIDMGGTSVKLGVCQGSAVLHKDEPITTEDFPGADAIVAEMARRVRSLRERHPQVAAIGVGVPGFVDAKTGIVHELTNVPGWREVLLGRELREMTGLPAVAENDANCMGVAEWRHGAARGLTDFLAITLGTGVGGAVFVNGSLYHGARSGAGEVGQMSIDYRGVDGPHGNVGALERYVGNRQIADRAQSLYAAAGKTKSDDECSPALLAAAAERGEAVALQVWEEFTTQLACSLANCCWLLNPQAIIIGGGIAAAGDLIFAPLRKKLAAQLAGPFRDNLLVVPAHFRNDAGIIGAAAIAEDLARD
ncbi:MAG: ROK family protein [Verrucomicrobiales bacterium]